MFMVLSSFYMQAIADRTLWNYYGISGFYSLLDLNNTNCCKSFIVQTLFSGEKNEGSSLYQFIDDLCPQRIRHIVSIFFMGIILYNNSCSIKNRIRETLMRYECLNLDFSSEDRRFSYVWMLICLFHDLGYAIEENTPCKEDYDWGKMPLKPKNFPKVFSKQLIKNYASFRLCKFGVYDHGILGGMKFYDDLCRLRERKSHSGCTERYWGEEMKQFYALAAWVIMCHNIWMIKETDKNALSYRCHGLKAIIGNTKYVISSKYHPLLFLFCLTDTIDFSKLLGREFFDAMCCIKLDFSDNKLLLDIPASLNVDTSVLLNMNSWLTNVKVNEGIIEITL